MLFAQSKNDAIAIYDKAVKKYNRYYEQLQERGNQLYQTRRDSVSLIQDVESLVNSIANSPKEFEKKLVAIHREREKFREVEEYAKESLSAEIQSGVSVAASVGAGTAFAAMAPSAAMWVATTYGIASTGTPIALLHGAIQTQAALAWLGGGALSAGGAGIVGGKALLALAGPIGWGISGTAMAASAFALGHKNKQIADEAIEEAKKVTIAGAGLNEDSAKIQALTDKTSRLLSNQRYAFRKLPVRHGADYRSLSEDVQYQLGALVNNTLSLAELLNQTI